MTPVFITGIGTGVGKTVVAAIVTEALQADYWKPVQTGYGEGTDSKWVRAALTNPVSKVHEEAYSLVLPASPHIAARQESITIRMETILARYREIEESCKLSEAKSSRINFPQKRDRQGQAALSGPDLERSSETAGNPLQTAARLLVIEGAGGLLVPLNDREFMLDLVKALDATTILVSRDYLGSINHSLLTAALCKSHGIKVAGWIFNEPYLQVEEEIESWSGIPAIAILPQTELPDRAFIREQAEKMRPFLQKALFPVDSR